MTEYATAWISPDHLAQVSLHPPRDKTNARQLSDRSSSLATSCCENVGQWSTGMSGLRRQRGQKPGEKRNPRQLCQLTTGARDIHEESS